VGSNDNTDANGWQYRGGDGHIIGESMPGTFGDSERVLHDKDGQTPTHDPADYEVPTHEELHEETTEDNGVEVEDLVRRLRE
jgi:hypothetical protein